MKHFNHAIALALAVVAMAGTLYVKSVYAQEQKQQQATPINHIERVQQANLMSGYPDGKFHPEGLVSRAELARIVVKTFAVEKRTPKYDKTFKLSDVPKDYWAYNDIQTVLRNDIMEGYHNDGRFYPNQKVTRSEAYAILAQAYGVFQFTPETQSEVLSQYPDAKAIPDWAQKAMATALHEGFVNTDEMSNRVRPLQPMTRGDMAYALSKYISRKYEYNP